MPTALVTRGSVVRGVRDPMALVIDLVPSVKVPNLTTVTAASLKVWRNPAREVTEEADESESWTCAMSNQTTSTLRLTHPWVEGDNDTPSEELHIYAQLTIAAEIVETRLVIVDVIDR